MNGVVSAWIDLDGDGSWHGVGEQILTNQPVVAGANSLPFLVPSTTFAGATFARFRFSTIGGLSFDGAAADGEVEDYKVDIIPVSDLVVSQADSPDPVASGGGLTYTITVQNTGPSTATGVTLNNTLPAGVTFVSASASQGGCHQNAGEVNCGLGSLNGGSSAQVSILVTAPSPGLLVNSVNVSANELDPQSTNNSATENTGVMAPPMILTPPQSLTVTAGNSATFTFTATGGNPLTYQWRYNGADLLGQTADTLTIPGAQAGNVGSYSVRVSNPVGAVISSAATLSVMAPPSISTLPVSQTNYAGGTATFTVEADGFTPLFYQWYFNSAAITNATNSTFVRAGLQATNSGAYQVRVTNLAGAIFSTPAALTVLEADFGDAFEPFYPSALTNNGARHLIVPGVFLGSRVDFESNGQPNSGASGDDLTGVDDEDGVFFLNPFRAGSVVNVLVIASTNGLLNAWVDFSRNNGWSNPDEQVFTNVALVPGSNALALRVPETASSGTTFARFRFSRVGNLSFIGETSDGEVEDYVATLQGAVDLSVMRLEATNLIAVGSNLTYTAVVSNAGPSTVSAVTFRDELPANVTFVSISSSQGSCSLSGSTLSCVFGPLPNGGAATITVIVAPNVAGNVINSVTVISPETDRNPGNNSASATATALVFPQIVTQPQGLTVTNGTAASLGVSALGTALQFHWQFNGVDIPGANGPILSIPVAGPAKAGNYTVRVSNALGSILSGAATLAILQPVTLLSQPQSLTVGLGGTATFRVTASGTEPVTYQWQFNGVDIGAENNSTLVITNTQLSQSGTYRVRVGNGINSMLSDPATLAVRNVAVIFQHPVSRTNRAGTTASFSVMATGLPPVLYQWYFNQTTPLAGQTATNLVLTNVQPAQAGGYSVAVSDSRGAVTSAVATLDVLEPLRIVSAGRAGTVTTISFATETGLNYVVEYKDAVDAASWNPLNLEAGTGAVLSVFDDSANAPVRIYRVRVE